MCNRNHIGLLVDILLFSAFACNAQIVKPPGNQIVISNDTAVFNCSLSCLQPLPVTWYMTLPSSGRSVAISPYTPLNQIKNIFGIDVSRGTVNECPQGGYFVEQLFVRAKKQLNLMPVQCSTVCIGEDCICGDTSQVHFSKFGILSIAPDMGIGILPSPSLSIAPSSTGYLQDSTIVPSLCSSYVYTATVTLPCGSSIPTPQAFPGKK